MKYSRENTFKITLLFCMTFWVIVAGGVYLLILK